MMYVGIILVCGLVCLYFSRNILNPGFLMSAIWVVVLALYESNILPYNDVSFLTYASITIGVVAFCIGTHFGNKFQIVIGGSGDNKEIYDANVKIIIFFEILSLLLMLPDVLNNIQLLLSGYTFETIRTNIQSGSSVINNVVLSLVRNYIVKPFLVIVYPLSAYCTFTMKGRERNYIFILSLFICLFHVFCWGGRSCLIYMLIHFVLTMILLKKDFNVPKKTVTGIVVLSVFILYIFNQVSISRGVSDVSTSFIGYISGCVPLMDIKINEVYEEGVYTYGGALLLGVLRLLFTMLENIGFSYPGFISIIETMANCEETLSVGQNLHMNAFVSCFYYFFMDGGLVGVFIDSFVYGWFSGSCYRRANEYFSPMRMIIYMIIIQSLVFSMVRYQFVQLDFVIALFLVRLLFVKRGEEDEIVDCDTVS